MSPSLAPTANSMPEAAKPAADVGTSVAPEKTGYGTTSGSFRDAAISEAVDNGTSVGDNLKQKDPYAVSAEDRARIPPTEREKVRGKPDAERFVAEAYRPESKPVTSQNEEVLSRRNIQPKGLVLGGEEVVSRTTSPIPARFQELADRDPVAKSFFEDGRMSTRRSEVALDHELAKEGADTASLVGKPYSDIMKMYVELDPDKALKAERADSLKHTPDLLRADRLRKGEMPVADVLRQYDADKAALAAGTLEAIPSRPRERPEEDFTSTYDRILEAQELRDAVPTMQTKGQLLPGEIVDIHLQHSAASRWDALNRSLKFLGARPEAISTVTKSGMAPEATYRALSEMEQKLIGDRLAAPGVDVSRN